jgi:hypothetical protein
MAAYGPWMQHPDVLDAATGDAGLEATTNDFDLRELRHRR